MCGNVLLIWCSAQYLKERVNEPVCTTDYNETIINVMIFYKELEYQN